MRKEKTSGFLIFSENIERNQEHYTVRSFLEFVLKMMIIKHLERQ